MVVVMGSPEEIEEIFDWAHERLVGINYALARGKELSAEDQAWLEQINRTSIHLRLIGMDMFDDSEQDTHDSNH